LYIAATGERRLVVVRIIQCVMGRYGVREVEFGRVYRWYPECIVSNVTVARDQASPAL